MSSLIKTLKGRNLLLILLSLLFISWHPYIPNLDKRQDNLKGNVKQVIERVNSWGDEFIAVKDYNRNGMLIQIKMYGLSDFDDNIIMGSLPDSISCLTDTNKLFLLENTIFTYNDNGELSGYTVYTKNGNYHKSKFQFNDKDSLSSIIESKFENGKKSMNVINVSHIRSGDTIIKSVTQDQKIIKTTKFILNSINQVIEMIETDHLTYKNKNECTKFTYNELGKIIKISTYPLKDSYYSKEKDDEEDENKKDITNLFFIYDAKGNLVKEEVYLNYAGKITNSVSAHFYDLNRKKIKSIISYYHDSTLTGRLTQIYNLNLDISQSLFEEISDYNDIQNTYLIRATIKYKYDRQGNWVKRKYHEDDNRFKDLRIIRYYDE